MKNKYSNWLTSYIVFVFTVVGWFFVKNMYFKDSKDE